MSAAEPREKSPSAKRIKTRHGRNHITKNHVVRTGLVDLSQNTIRVDMLDAKLAERKADWNPPPLKATRGILHKYIRLVRSASEGCVTDE